MYRIYRAARYIGCAPWKLAKMPEVWMEWALCFESAESRAQEIARKIADQRGTMAQGGGKTPGESDEEDLQDLIAQIEAQGGKVERRKDDD